MKYRLNGFSTPFFGVSWDNVQSSKEWFCKFLIFLESKRILTNPKEMEKKEWCIHSVLEIKQFLSNLPDTIEFSKEEYSIIRAMIYSCNEYLDNVSNLDLPNIIFKANDYNWADLKFDGAMKKFRNSFKLQIMQIEKKHKLKFNKEIPEEY